MWCSDLEFVDVRWFEISAFGRDVLWANFRKDMTAIYKSILCDTRKPLESFRDTERQRRKNEDFDYNSRKNLCFVLSLYFPRCRCTSEKKSHI